MILRALTVATYFCIFVILASGLVKSRDQLYEGRIMCRGPNKNAPFSMWRDYMILQRIILSFSCFLLG